MAKQGKQSEAEVSSMIRLAKASLLYLGLGSLLLGSSVNAQNGEAELATVLQRLLDSQVQEQDILGMTMIVRPADGIVVGGVSGHVNPPKEEVWTVDTPTAIGSITKTFIAVIVMQLVEEGKLSLDDTVNTWFPEQPRGKRITVRMLLSHTSGLANYITPGNVMDGTWDRVWTPEELIAKANKLAPVSKPGSKEAHYANTNFILLGMIIEQVTGNTWSEEVSTRIIEPLNLQHTTFLSAKGVLSNLIKGYSHTEAGYQNLMEAAWYPHHSSIWSAGEMVASASDLLTFARALFEGKLVSNETLLEMAQPLGTDSSGILWGLGGATFEGEPVYGMGGDIPGFHAFFIGNFDSDVLVVAVTNTEGGDVIGPSLTVMDYLSAQVTRE